VIHLVKSSQANSAILAALSHPNNTDKAFLSLGIWAVW
jgi:hypothetical protein